jgi:phosphatidylserine/phosphatidylglycerophosphate/cardiolipin synthase-like enzyme
MKNTKGKKNSANKKANSKRVFWENRENSGKMSDIPEKISNLVLIPKQKDEEDSELKKVDYNQSEPGLLMQELINIIGSAHEFICISSFVIGNRRIQDALTEAYQRNVRIYFLTASENYLDKELLSERDIKSLANHIRFLKEIQGKVLIRSSKDYHLKCILIDPKNRKNKKGYVMTCNLTGAVYKSPDIAVKLTNTQIDVIFHQFLIGFYILATGELRNDGLGDLAKQPKNLPIELPKLKSSKAGIYPTIKHQNQKEVSEYDSLKLKDQLIKFIQDSDGELKLFAWNFDDRNDSVKEILLQLKRGRAVKIITNSKSKNNKIKPGLSNLLNAGAEIYGIPFFHAKGVISKENGKLKAFIMTSNFENAGIDYGFNTGIMINDEGQALKLNNLFDEWCRCSKFKLKKE